MGGNPRERNNGGIEREMVTLREGSQIGKRENRGKEPEKGRRAPSDYKRSQPINRKKLKGAYEDEREEERRKKATKREISGEGSKHNTTIRLRKQGKKVQVGVRKG